MHSHSFKYDKSLGTTQQLKRVVNASQNLTLMSMQVKEEKNPKHEEEVSLHHSTSIMVDNGPMKKHKHDTSTNSFTYSMLIFSLLLISSIIWLVPTILNEDFVKKGVNVLNNICAVLMIIMLSQMYRFQEWTSDTGQVRRTCPHLFSE